MTFAFRKLSRVLNILLTNLSQYPLHDENLAPSYSTYLHSMTLLRQRSQRSIINQAPEIGAISKATIDESEDPLILSRNEGACAMVSTRTNGLRFSAHDGGLMHNSYRYSYVYFGRTLSVAQS